MTLSPASESSIVALAGLVDHTVLEETATAAEVYRACQVAAAYGCATVCVRPEHVRSAAALLEGTGVGVATVAGFPTGMTSTAVKIEQASQAHMSGAVDIDMVLRVDSLLLGDHTAVAADIAAVRRAVPAVTLKVIIESAALTAEQIAAASHIVACEGAEFVKTSTGFHRAGGASAAAVSLIAATAPGLGIKASGGIRTREQAMVMVAAGATRLGTSATAHILGVGDDAGAGY